VETDNADEDAEGDEEGEGGEGENFMFQSFTKQLIYLLNLNDANRRRRGKCRTS
jgi:hypothetical protein